MSSRKASATSSATVAVESDIRDFTAEQLKPACRCKPGDWYNAKQVEDTVTDLNELAGLFGYAFADVSPHFNRDADKTTMGITFQVAETPRVYVERIDISGNTTTRDKVIRREFRLAEGDPFNNVHVKRSHDRIQSLGYFQDNLEIQQNQGSAPDRVVLGVEVEESATGQLQLSAGYSSLEHFLLQPSVEQRNFMGRGQEVARRHQLFELFQVGRAGLHRALSVRPATSRSASTSSGATTTASTSSATRATRPISRPRPAARSAPACRSPSTLQLRRFATASTTTRSRSTRTFITPIPTAPVRCRRSATRCSPAAICATRSATA